MASPPGDFKPPPPKLLKAKTELASGAETVAVEIQPRKKVMRRRPTMLEERVPCKEEKE